MQTDIIKALIGGIMIGASATFLLYYRGRIAGISGIIKQSIFKDESEFNWSVLFLLGLLSGGFLISFFFPQVMERPEAKIELILLAGFLVGFGTNLGNGCTSGHGICGISRFSPRSIIATCTFVLTGVLTVYGLRIIGVIK